MWVCNSAGLARYSIVARLEGAGDEVTTAHQLTGVRLPPLDTLRVGLEWDSVEDLKVNSVAPPGAGIPDAPGTVLTEQHYVLEAMEDMVIDGQPAEGLRIAVSGQNTFQFVLQGFVSNPVVRSIANTLVYGRGIGLMQGAGGTLLSYTIP